MSDADGSPLHATCNAPDHLAYMSLVFQASSPTFAMTKPHSQPTMILTKAVHGGQMDHRSTSSPSVTMVGIGQALESYTRDFESF